MHPLNHLSGRCRAADTTYATQNGGQWPFYIDAPGSPAAGQMAVPLSQDFWNYLMASSVNEWGLTTYEQDWLYNLFDGAFEAGFVRHFDRAAAQRWMQLVAHARVRRPSVIYRCHSRSSNFLVCFCFPAGVDLLSLNISAGRLWLTQMNAGAAAAGVNIQYW